MKILYVEDEIPHVELAQRTLEDNLKENFILYHRETYRGALELLENEHDIDLVLTDYRLPDGSGMDLIKYIQRKPAPPAVVLITGQGDEQVAVAAIKAGANDYIVKQSDYLYRLPIVITNAITQKKLEQEKVAKRTTEDRYQSLVEQTPAVVFLDDVDVDETTLYISPRIEELTGYTPEAWLADPKIWEKSIHPDDKERILRRDRDTHTLGENFQDEYRFIRSDGRVIWIKEDTNLIRDQNGRPLYWQGILLDLTKEKETEAALQRQLIELTILNGISAASAESDTEDEIIERVVQISSLLYNEVSGVFLLDKEGKFLTPHSSFIGASIENWDESVPITEGITGRSIRTGKPVRLDNVAADPDFIGIVENTKSELCVPIRVNRRIIGVFNVESRKPKAYSEYDENFLSTIAGNLGAAIENIRLFREDKRRTHELNALYQSTKPLTQSLEPITIASNLLNIMDELLGYEYSSIYLTDEGQKFLLPIAISRKAKNPEIYVGDLDSSIKEKRSINTGILGWVAKNGKTYRSGDVSADDRYLPVIKNIRSEVCVPLIARNQIIGVINVETIQPDAYTQRDEDLLITIANSAAISLENARLYETERLRREESEALREATASLSLHIELNSLLDQILISIKNIVPYDSASIFLGAEDGDMEIVAARGFDNVTGLIGRKVPHTDKWLDVINTRQIMIMSDVQKDARFEQWEGSEKIRGWIGIPMINQDRIIGFINLDSHKADFFSERDAILAQTFANSAAVAVQNARLFSTEREQLKREQALQELMRVTTSTLEFNQVMEIILSQMISLIPSDSGTIQLLSGSLLRITAANGFPDNSFVIGQTLLLEDYPVNRQVIETRRPVRFNNIESGELYTRVKGLDHIISFLAVPIVYKDKTIGIATLDSQIENRFTEKDMTFAMTIANQAAIAMENASLYEEALMASERRSVLHRISQDIIRFNQDAEQIYSAIHESTSKLMPCDVFMISIINDQENSHNFVYTMEKNIRHDLDSEPIDAGLPGMVFQNRSSLILKNKTEIDKHDFLRFGSSNQAKSVAATPLRIREKMIGMIAAQSYEEDSYGNEQLLLLEMLATHASTAIENLRLYNETQRRLKEMETINRVSSSMRGIQKQDTMLDILLNEALTILGAEDGSVWIFNTQENMLIQRKAKGSATGLYTKRLSQSDGLVGHVFVTGEAYISAELRDDPYLIPENRESVNAGTGGILIPLQSTVGTLGVLTIRLASNRASSEHVSILTTLAEIAGNAIHRAELFEQSQEQIRKLTTLRDIDSAITSSTDLRVTLNILIDNALKHLRVDAVDILLYHPELQNLTYFNGAGFFVQNQSRPKMRLSDGLAGQVVMSGDIVKINNLMQNNINDPLLKREQFVSYVGVPVVVKGQIKGVFEVFTRTPLTTNDDWVQFLLTLAGQAAIAIDNSQLFDNLQKSNDDLKRAYDTTLEGWARALELRDRETEGHTRRVTDLTMQLAQFMKIPDDELEDIYRGVLLHDIGKMGVPDQILRKTGPLDESEWSEMRKHPQYAYELLLPIQYLKLALEIPYCHHEHWDGSGYPRGLKGEEIPLAARIFSVVDIWDALLSDRPYRKAWSREKTIAYLKDVAGSILDPSAVQAFLKMIGDMNI